MPQVFAENDCLVFRCGGSELKLSLDRGHLRMDATDGIAVLVHFASDMSLGGYMERRDGVHRGIVSLWQWAARWMAENVRMVGLSQCLDEESTAEVLNSVVFDWTVRHNFRSLLEAARSA